MKVINEINIYELDGKDCRETGGGSRKQLTVQSHWMKDEFVVLQFQDMKITVKASELQKAIQNSCNWKSLM